MPKRKRDSDTYEYITRKIRKLEKKLLRRANKDRSSSSRSASPQRSQIEDSETMEPGVFMSDDECIIQIPEVIVETNPQNEEQIPIVQQPQPSTSTAPEPPEQFQLQSTVIPVEGEDPVNNDLDSSTLALLGEDPTSKAVYGNSIQKDLALRLEHWATVGLSKDLREQLTTRYMTPSNCTLIDPPILNAEIKAAISDIVAKRDKAIETKQKQLSVALSGIGEAITKLLSSKERDESLVKTLMDVGRIVCDSQQKDSMTRKNFILSTLKKEMKDQLLSTKIDKFLFGENLPEILKSAKAINKSCADLKNNPPHRPKPQVQKPNTSTARNLNWKGAPAARRQPAAGAPRTKTSASAPAQHRHQNTSRTSHNPSSRSRR